MYDYREMKALQDAIKFDYVQKAIIDEGIKTTKPMKDTKFLQLIQKHLQSYKNAQQI